MNLFLFRDEYINLDNVFKIRFKDDELYFFRSCIEIEGTESDYAVYKSLTPSEKDAVKQNLEMIRASFTLASPEIVFDKETGMIK